MPRPSLNAQSSTSILRGELLGALNLAKVALGKATFVPVLSHFCLTGSAVEAFDDTTAVSVAFDTSVVCAVPGDLLLRLLTSLSSSTVALELKDNALHIAGARSKLKLPALGEEAFVFNHKYGTLLSECIVNQQVLEGIGKCLVSVGADPTHPAQMGITITGGDSATLYSTDNVTMSRFDLGAGVWPEEESVLLPTMFCQQLLGLAKAFEGEELVIQFYDSCAVCLFGEKAKLYTKLLAIDKPLNFDAVFKSMVPKGGSYTELPPSWEAAFVRAAALADQKAPATHVVVEEGQALLDTTSTSGVASDSFDWDAPAADFWVDPQHVIRATKVCDQVQFGKRAVVMRQGEFTHLITHCSRTKAETEKKG